MPYRFVLFDVGGTLVGPRGSFGAVYARALADLGLALDPARAEQSLQQAMREMEQAIPRGADRYRHFPGGEQEFWLRFARRTLELASGAPVDSGWALCALDRIRDVFREPGAWTVFPDVRPALDALKQDGARMAVVSNWDSQLPRVLEMLGLAPYFAEIGVSHLEGVEKPDPEIFRRVLARLGAQPAEALHVGDVPGLDIAGARAAGVAAVLVDRRGVPGLDDQAIPSLSELPSIVRGSA